MNNTQQEQEQIKFLVMPFDILAIKELNMTDKFVLARIAGFRTFFEASQTTADFLGLTKLQVDRAKRKLSALGYIEELADTGRGKVYRCADVYSILDKMDGARKVTSDVTSKSHQVRRKSHIENKVENKDENIINAPSADDDSSKEYGRADINELIRNWSEQVHDIQGDKTQRRYAYNLIRKYGAEGAQELVERVATMKRKNDRFAPNIAKLSDLMGKYSKLDKLEAWEQRQQAESKPNEPQYTPPPAYFRTPDLSDYGDAWREVPDEEHARISQQIKDARSKMPFFNKGGKK
jgi:hypothetical protein